MNRNRFLALAMAGAMTLAAAVPAYATGSGDTTTVTLAVEKTTYDLVVPATLNVKDSGYNAFENGVTIKNLQNGTGVTSIDVTATSTNDWKLKDDTSGNTVSYTLAANDAQGTARTTYSFTNAEAMAGTNGETVACGVNVSDYSSAAAGNYSDTITWTAEVKKTTTTEVTLCSGTGGGNWSNAFTSNSYTKDGVTYTYGSYDAYGGIGFKNGTFKADSGVITKIVITTTKSGEGGCAANASGEDWSTTAAESTKTATWSGTAAGEVAFTGNFYGDTISVIVTVER